MATASATEAAEAVYALLGFCSSDKEALLGVIQDYFTSPDSAPDDLDNDDNGLEILLEGNH